MEELHPVAFHKGTAGASALWEVPAFLLKRARQAGKVHGAPSGNFLPLLPLRKHNCPKQEPCSLLSELWASALSPNPKIPGELPGQGSHPWLRCSTKPRAHRTHPLPCSGTEPWPFCSFKWQKTLGGCIYLLGQMEATLSPSVLPIVEDS